MKKRIRTAGFLLAVLALVAVFWVFADSPELLEESIVTREGMVLDRAMSGGLGYISVEFSDGSCICCWEIYRGREIPESIQPGQRVKITYALEESHNRYVVLEVKQIS